MFTLLLSLACETSDEGCGSSHGVVVSPPECPRSCLDYESLFACCLADHGRGLTAEGDIDRLKQWCSGEDCDAQMYLSAAAASCMAYGQGMGGDYATYFATFWMSGTADAWWLVDATEDVFDCEPGTLVDVEGVSGQIDARTGRSEGFGSTTTTGRCVAGD